MRTYYENINADFTCKYCGAIVSTWQALSGVVNRNHCPYCLHSRHLDLFEAGDRLSACKDLMVPVGLTMKKSRDKYANQSQGELMLVHVCKGCEQISINRIAADDDPEKILELVAINTEMVLEIKARCDYKNIHLLHAGDQRLVQTRLYGLDFVSKNEEVNIYMNF